jgi:hypothetical protein
MSCTAIGFANSIRHSVTSSITPIKSLLRDTSLVRAKHPISPNSTPSDKNNSLYPNPETPLSSAHLIPSEGAGRDRHGSWDGLRWTRAALAPEAVAGRVVPVSDQRAHRRRPARVRQNRVVLAPAGWRQVFRGGVRAQPGGAHQRSREATGARVQRSPGRARHKPSNHCAGKAGYRAAPVSPL